MSLLRMVAPLVAVAACYNPKQSAIPTITKPTLEDGAAMSVRTYVIETGDYEIDYRGKLRKETRTRGSASYGGNKLTFAEAQALADPGWDRKMSDLRGKHRACSRGRVPSTVGYSAMIVGGLLGMIVGIKNGNNSTSTLSSTDKVLVYASLGAFAFGIGSNVVGFGLGGYACAGVRETRREMGVDDDSTVLMSHEADRIGKLARAFNAKRKVDDVSASE